MLLILLMNNNDNIWKSGRIRGKNVWGILKKMVGCSGEIG